MGIDLVNYEEQALESVKAFWGNREAARQKQAASGKLDQGNRAAVTAGKNMDGFLVLIRDIVCRNGLDNASICLKRPLYTLPGYFRATKHWDVVVTNADRLVAAIELKSMVGSVGKNLNNRAEEVIGSAVDLKTAFREGVFGESSYPFVGWLLLLEDSDEARKPRRNGHNKSFNMFSEFKGAPYAERYNILCRKLVQEQLYTAATVILSPQSAVDTGEYSEVSEMTGLKRFVTKLAGHIAAEAAGAG